MKTGEPDTPPWDFVKDVLDQRIDTILFHTKSDIYTIYLTSGVTFRYALAKKKPYKATRQAKKPWHFDNLTAYMRDVLGASVCTYLEADDAMAIDHVSSNGTTILCSRDKDCRQIPGRYFSWELGQQPSFGPTLITKEGSLEFTPANAEKKRPAKLSGTGLSWFYAQVLMGDSTDNIPGLPGCGAVRAYELLNGYTPEQQLSNVLEEYALHYGYTDQVSPLALTEQGQLCWLVRRLNEDGSPQLWKIGMTE